jgi:hypothetical protein
MEAVMREMKPPLPNPLLHKCVEEREKTQDLSFMSQRWQGTAMHLMACRR